MASLEFNPSDPIKEESPRVPQSPSLSSKNIDLTRIGTITRAFSQGTSDLETPHSPSSPRSPRPSISSGISELTIPQIAQNSLPSSFRNEWVKILLSKHPHFFKFFRLSRFPSLKSPYYYFTEGSFRAC